MQMVYWKINLHVPRSPFWAGVSPILVEEEAVEEAEAGDKVEVEVEIEVEIVVIGFFGLLKEC